MGGSPFFSARSGDELGSPYAQKFSIDLMQQNCISMMGVDNLSLFGGHAFTESLQARDDLLKQPHDVRPARPEYPLFDEKDHLGHMFVGESQIAMNECKVLSCAQQILTAA